MGDQILLVDDDPGLRRIVSDALAKAGLSVTAVGTGAQALEKLGESVPDLLVLDLGLPDMDGLEVLEKMQSDPGLKVVPVLCLTARAASREVVRGLDVGADDYVTKPFNEQELVSRVRAVLRRRRLAQVETPAEVLEAGLLRLEVRSHSAWVSKKAVDLTYREFAVLLALMKKAEQALTREKIVELAWGPGTNISPRVIDVHIAHLRKKLGSAARKYLQAVPQAGYRFSTKSKFFL